MGTTGGSWKCCSAPSSKKLGTQGFGADVGGPPCAGQQGEVPGLGLFLISPWWPQLPKEVSLRCLIILAVLIDITLLIFS